MTQDLNKINNVVQKIVTQCAEKILDEIAKAINETLAGLKYIPYKFRIYFV